MAVYNTTSGAANTAVRAFLMRVGEYYLKHSFNTASGKGKQIWESIRDLDFQSCCAYCGEIGNTLQIEHLLMFNRTEYGLHHPGNIVPSCKSATNVNAMMMELTPIGRSILRKFATLALKVICSNLED